MQITTGGTTVSCSDQRVQFQLRPRVKPRVVHCNCQWRYQGANQPCWLAGSDAATPDHEPVQHCRTDVRLTSDWNGLLCYLDSVSKPKTHYEEPIIAASACMSDMGTK